MSPSFTSGVQNYFDTIPGNAASITISATPADGANITINGGSSNQVSISQQSTPIIIQVTAQDGIHINSDTVKVWRLGTIALLNSLTLATSGGNPITLSPSFSTNNLLYTAAVANGVSSVILNAIPTDPNSIVKYGNNALPATIVLGVGTSDVDLTVMSEDKQTTTTYRITINRSGASDASLQNLTVSTGSLNFNYSTTDYIVKANYNDSTISITPTTTDPNATVVLNSNSVQQGTPAQIKLNKGGNNATIVVTAQDGHTQITYSLTIIRAFAVTISNDGYCSTSPTNTVNGYTGDSINIAVTNVKLGYHFNNWQLLTGTGIIIDTTDSATKVVMGATDIGIKASCLINSYTLTMIGTGNGTVSPAAPTIVKYGIAQAITATSVTGYHFVSWSVTAGSASVANLTDSSTTATLSNGNATIAATFAIDTFQITIVTTPRGQITLSPSNTSNKFVYGTSVTASAAPSSGYGFKQWTQGLSGTTSTQTFTLLSNINLAAAYLPIDTLTYSPTNGGTVVCSTSVIKFPAGSGRFFLDSGTAVTLTAIDSSCYMFSYWSGTLSSTSSQFTFVLSSNTNLTANFTNVALPAPTITYSCGTGNSQFTITDNSGAGATIMYRSKATISDVTGSCGGGVAWSAWITATSSPFTNPNFAACGGSPNPYCHDIEAYVTKAGYCDSPHSTISY